jgi:hypothetical protein
MTDDRLNKILQQYHQVDDDYGFSAVSEEEYNQKIDSSAKSAASQTAEEYKDRLDQVEKIIIPFLTKLHSSGDKEYIYWPNRKPVIEQQIEKILKLTRD